MRRFSVFLNFLFFLIAISSSRAQSVSPAAPITNSVAQKIVLPGIHNAGKVSGTLYRGAQPNLSSFSVLKNLGITTIVNLRAESDARVDRERREAEAQGLHFVNIPVGGFDNPSDEQLATFFSLLREQPPQTVFVHCEYGRDRTGVFIAAYRIAFQNWSADQAVTEMLTFGFNRPFHRGMERYVRALPEKLQSDATLRSALAKP